MIQQKVSLKHSEGVGYVIPAGPVNIVHVVAAHGMVGCGAFDVMALDRFGYPAARVRPSTGTSVSSVGDLLDGIIREANVEAQKRGVTVGMTGKEALDLLS